MRVAFLKNCKFKEIILRVASCVLWIENFKSFSLRVASCFLRVESLRWYCLRVAKLPFTSWTFTMPILRITITCFKSNFKEINRKLCEEAILIKCIITLDSSNAYQPNATETVIKTLDQQNSSSCRNSPAVSYNNWFVL